MAVLVKGQPFSLIGKLTTPITTRMDTKTHHTSTPQAGRPIADHRPQLTEGPATGTPTTEGGLQAGPAIPLQPQKGN